MANSPLTLRSLTASKPILGVVYAPVMNVMYSAAEAKRGKRRVRCAQANSGPRCAPAAGGISRSHADAELKSICNTAWRTSDHVHRLFAEIHWWRKGHCGCTRASDQRIFGTPPLDMLSLQLPERTFTTGAGKPAPDYTPRGGCRSRVQSVYLLNSDGRNRVFLILPCLPT